MNLNTSLKVNYSQLVLFVILLLLTTVLRLSLLILAPPLILLICVHFGFTFRRSLVTIFVVIGFSFVLSLFNGIYIKYNLLSFYYILPFLVLLFSKPKYYSPKADLFSSFMKILTGFMILNNAIGIIQYINFPNDDSLVGLYGHFTVTQNGLSVINSILLFYYLMRFVYNRQRTDLWLFLFFGITFIMGFYGGGILAVMGVFAVQLLRLSFRKIIIGLFSGAIILLAIGVCIYFIRPDTLRYNLNIIHLFAGKEGEPTPRKLLSYTNYARGYSPNVKDFIFGSGPGTFNSRSAFIIGSPDYFKMWGVFKSADKPYYFENYAYSLWNRSNTGKWQEGFMNQPFSSLLAFLGEYGLLFTLFFAFYYFQQHSKVTRYITYSKDDLIAKDTYRFCSLLLIFLLIIDNYAEYPEITILILLLMKMAELKLITSNNYHQHA